MNISLLQNNLKRGLNFVSGVHSKNINLPILNNILIEAKGGMIQIVATNLEIAITSVMRGKIKEEGAVTVDGKLFTNYVSLLPNEKVDIKQAGASIELSCGNFQTKMHGQSSDEFPLIPSLENTIKFVVGINELKNALIKTVFAASTNEMRPEMCGVCFVFKGKNITLAATDGFRLSEQKIINTSDKMGSEDDFSVIVPNRTISELLKIFSNTSLQEGDLEKIDLVDIEITENQILFKIGTTTLFSRLIIGNFPDYKQIIPTTHNTTVLVSRTELLRAIKTSSLFSKDEANDVAINVNNENQSLTISSSNQSGENSVKIDAEITGQPNSLIINYRFMVDGLNVMNTDKIKIEIVDSETPCIINEINTDNIYLVMPLKQ